MKFEFTNESQNILKGKAKLYSTLTKSLNKAYFKVNGDKMNFVLRGSNGAMNTTLDVVNNDSTDVVYFSVDYLKWNTALQKFADAESIVFNITKSILKMGAKGSSDVISLCITTFTEDSSEASVIDNFIAKSSEAIIKDGHEVILSDDLVGNLLMVNAFMTQGSYNSIGLGENNVLYASRAAIVKAHLDDALPSVLFENLEDDDYIFIHTDILNLLALFHQTNDSVWFSDDYGVVYWHDDSTELVIQSENRNASLPSEEEWNDVKPQDTSMTIEMPVGTLESALAFFNGFYEESVWKPLTFDIKKGKSAILRYKSATTDIAKELTGVIGSVDGNFVLASDILERVLAKVKERVKDTDTIVSINYDEDAIGVYIKVTDKYEFVLSKINDGE